MTKFSYIYFKKDKKLRILNSKLNSKLTVVFLHGLKSDMEGKKPLFLNRYCKKNKVKFLSLEYAGHGKSYGKFENGTITQWMNNVKFVIRKIVKKEKFLIVGSSLGAWVWQARTGASACECLLFTIVAFGPFVLAAIAAISKGACARKDGWNALVSH